MRRIKADFHGIRSDLPNSRSIMAGIKKPCRKSTAGLPLREKFLIVGYSARLKSTFQGPVDCTVMLTMPVAVRVMVSEV